MDARAETGSGPTRASLVVLAGGASRRLGGGRKAFLDVGGREVLERILTEAARPFADVVLVVDDVTAYSDALARYGVRRARIVRDRRPGLGPLAGIEAGLEAVEQERAWVVACDLPFLVPAVGWTLLAALDASSIAANGPRAAVTPDAALPRAAVPRIGGRLQPLCAAYERHAGGVATACLDAGHHRTFDLLDRLEVVRVPASAFAAAGDPTRLFLNINEPADLERAHRLAEGEQTVSPPSSSGPPGRRAENIRPAAE